MCQARETSTSMRTRGGRKSCLTSKKKKWGCQIPPLEVEESLVRFPNPHYVDFQVSWRIWLRRAWLQSCKFLGLGNRSRIRCGSRRRLPSVPVILAPESWIIDSLLLSSSTSQFISGSRVLQCKSQERIGRQCWQFLTEPIMGLIFHQLIINSDKYYETSEDGAANLREAEKVKVCSGWLLLSPSRDLLTRSKSLSTCRNGFFGSLGMTYQEKKTYQ